MQTDETDTRDPIEEILQTSKVIAVVGLSDDPERPSNRVARYLKRQGYRIIPVNPGVGEALGERSYPDLGSVPEEVDVVDVFRRPEHVPAIAHAAVEKGARALWLQDGISHPESEQMARAAGLKVVTNDCMLRQHLRLRREGKL